MFVDHKNAVVFKPSLSRLRVNGLSFPSTVGTLMLWKVGNVSAGLMIIRQNGTRLTAILLLDKRLMESGCQTAVVSVPNQPYPSTILFVETALSGEGYGNNVMLG